MRKAKGHCSLVSTCVCTGALCTCECSSDPKALYAYPFHTHQVQGLHSARYSDGGGQGNRFPRNTGWRMFLIGKYYALYYLTFSLGEKTLFLCRPLFLFTGVTFLLPPGWSQGLNSDLEPWQQAPFLLSHLTAPSVTFYKTTKNKVWLFAYPSSFSWGHVFLPLPLGSRSPPLSSNFVNSHSLASRRPFSDFLPS